MKPIKQIFNDMLAWWEEKFKDRRFRTGVICIIISVVLFVLTWCLALIPSSAEGPSLPEHNPDGSPTNLTGYIVTVPDNWSASAGYGLYSLSGTVSAYLGTYDFIVSEEPNFAIGYDTDGSFSPEADFVSFVADLHASGSANIYLGESFSLAVTGGDDSDNPSLIQWLVANNATFRLNTPGEPDEPTPLATFSKGLYKVNPLWYNTTITTQLDGMEFYSLNEGTTYTALTVQNNELVFDDENLETLTVARKGTTGVIWLDNSGQFVYYTNDESIPQSLADQIPTLLEYIPDVTLEDFQRMQDSWYYGVQDGFIASEQNYDAGYEAGFDAGVENSGGNFFGNFIESILNSLDKLVILPGDISILDVIKAVCGIFVVVWLLKLLAGG